MNDRLPLGLGAFCALGGPGGKLQRRTPVSAHCQCSDGLPNARIATWHAWLAMLVWSLAAVSLSIEAMAAGRDSAATPDEEAREDFRLGISGQHRARYERLEGQYLPMLDDDDQALALRTSVVVAAEWPRWRVTGELMDSRVELNDEGSTLEGTIINSFEPLQLAVTREWADLPGGGTAALSIGRLTLDLGKRRLVARNRFRNFPNSFVGVDWQWSGADGRAARAFYLKPMVPLPLLDRDALLDNERKLDEPARHTRLRGIHYHFPIARNDHRLELYLIDLSAEEELDRRELTTFGARIYRPPEPGRWSYEIEAIAQSGESADFLGDEPQFGLDHDASYRYLEVGYGFDTGWSPVLSLLHTSASGDEDPFDAKSERFDTLYGSRSFELGPSGIYGPFERSNIEATGFRLTLAPTNHIQAMLSYRSFRLESAADYWMGTEFLDSSAESGKSLGRQLESSIAWTALPGRLGFELGLVHFTKGRFVRQVSGLDEPSTYLYASTTVSF